MSKFITLQILVRNTSEVQTNLPCVVILYMPIPCPKKRVDVRLTLITKTYGIELEKMKVDIRLDIDFKNS